MGFTVTEIKNSQWLAEKLGLENSERFCAASPSELQTTCNGIGAEWMPEWSRKLLDKRYSVMQIPAMIHDQDYSLGTGTKEDFLAANTRLKTNGYIMAKNCYPWYNPARYLIMNDARRLAKVCDAFGWKAYTEAIEARKKEVSK